MASFFQTVNVSGALGLHDFVATLLLEWIFLPFQAGGWSHTHKTYWQETSKRLMQVRKLMCFVYV